MNRFPIHVDSTSPERFEGEYESCRQFHARNCDETPIIPRNGRWLCCIGLQEGPRVIGERLGGPVGGFNRIIGVFPVQDGS